MTSLNGLRFRALVDVAGGEITPATTFTYYEEDGQVWGDYRGGAIRRGHLVGTRDGDTVDFRYVQLNTDGETNSGHCVSRVSTLPDGRVRLDETWEWESREGNGTSAVEQIS
ncbi:hypothetical protein [Spirillospora sp. CA-294931]|uniref:hypothetical protein n=1 Tax=Spirillospora sp. CA-294931 TaxID=3240042 RepID=UPI003D8A47BB